MLAAVDRLLGGEALDLLGQLLRSALAELPDAFDEEGFALGEGRRERIVECGRERIAAMPPAARLCLAREAPVAGRDGEIDGSHTCGVHQTTPSTDCGQYEVTYINVNKLEIA